MIYHDCHISPSQTVTNMTGFVKIFLPTVLVLFSVTWSGKKESIATLGLLYVQISN